MTLIVFRFAVAATVTACALLHYTDVDAEQTLGHERIALAAKSRDKETVIALLAQGVHVDAPLPDGSTALHWAVHWKDVEMVRRLVRAGANVNMRNDLGVTPLLLACSDATEDVIELLMAAGGDAVAALPTGETGLMILARAGKARAIRSFLARGASTEARESFREQTALMFAVAERQLESARVLLDGGALVDARSASGHTALLFASRTGDESLGRLLLERGANVNATANDGSTPLLVATTRGHAHFAIFLLEHGAEPNAAGAGYTALHWTAGKWQSTMTPFYANTSLAGELFWVAEPGRMQLLNALPAHGADPNARLTRDSPRYGTSIWPRKYIYGGTPLMMAALVGDVNVMRTLIANGADPLTRTENQTTILMAAAEFVEPEADHLDAVRFALELGVSINATNDDGDTALHAVAFAGLDTVASYLIQQGADLSAKNRAGRIPLDVAEGTEFVMMIYRNESTAALLREASKQPPLVDRSSK